MITAKEARKLTEFSKQKIRRRWKIAQELIDFVDRIMLKRIEKKIIKAAGRGRNIIELRFFGSKNLEESLRKREFSTHVFYSDQTSCERKKILIGW